MNKEKITLRVLFGEDADGGNFTVDVEVPKNYAFDGFAVTVTPEEIGFTEDDVFDNIGGAQKRMYDEVMRRTYERLDALGVSRTEICFETRDND